MTNAGISIRPIGLNIPEGRQSRAAQADTVAAARVGTDDLLRWLRQRWSSGASLTELGKAVGHSAHWVRWRLERYTEDTSH